MEDTPLIVHGCHCTWCQRQTGTAFATNALIEADRVTITKGQIENTLIETPGGSGQRIARCPNCKVAVWSEYLVMTSGLTDLIYFIRVGTLDTPESLPPDVHIYTSTKLQWVRLPPGALAVQEYYETDETWSSENLKRRDALRETIERLKR
ncbi:GFA family protein [Aliiroseovarius subalbicans]|uniref:GFA family protein n=1 Tax=Aliiroseovarius subalbicans TaxID=2925840 RepID=UPI001F58A06E|nr:GFA family protein [Aliiroseovarius subalbicans]MCI2398554.1 GFA family protein [Aliiroseovarius subalbicans]